MDRALGDEPDLAGNCKELQALRAGLKGVCADQWAAMAEEDKKKYAQQAAGEGRRGGGRGGGEERRGWAGVGRRW